MELGGLRKLRHATARIDRGADDRSPFRAGRIRAIAEVRLSGHPFSLKGLRRSLPNSHHSEIKNPVASRSTLGVGKRDAISLLGRLSSGFLSILIASQFPSFIGSESG